jgi:hypothetical protein
MLASKLIPVRRVKIKDVFLLLFGEGDRAESDLGALRAAGLTALDMQMLIHRSSLSPFPFLSSSLCFPFQLTLINKIVLYTHLWASTFSNPLASLPTTSISVLLQPFRCAMSNWKLLWDEIKSSSLEKGEWNKLGFQRAAEGYFEAVREVADGFEKRGGGIGGIKSDCEKGMHLRKILSF